MALQTDPFSRFNRTETVFLGGHEVFGRWRLPDVLKNEQNADRITHYQVRAGRQGRPDLISRDIYGTTHLDWLIIAFNDATDVLNWPRVGTVIKLPARALVIGELA